MSEDGAAVYRPTVHYAYCPADAAIASLHELHMRGYELQTEQRIMNDDIVDGRDELGVLLMGHPLTSWWIGSLLDIHEARRLVPHQNATTLQVAAARARRRAVAARRTRRRGVRLPDDLPHDEILAAAPTLPRARRRRSGPTGLRCCAGRIRSSGSAVPARPTRTSGSSRRSSSTAPPEAWARSPTRSRASSASAAATSSGLLPLRRSPPSRAGLPGRHSRASCRRSHTDGRRPRQRAGLCRTCSRASASLTELPIELPVDDTPYWLRGDRPLAGHRSRPTLWGVVDVLVVGAGLTGASAAYHLAGRGLRVAVVDAGDPAGEASGRNGGNFELVPENSIGEYRGLARERLKFVRRTRPEASRAESRALAERQASAVLRLTLRNRRRMRELVESRGDRVRLLPRRAGSSSRTTSAWSEGSSRRRRSSRRTAPASSSGLRSACVPSSAS